jgi:hypothetical protein
MSFTAYHAKNYTLQVTRAASTGLDRLSISLFHAAVDLTPHPIEAGSIHDPMAGRLIRSECNSNKKRDL